MKTLESVDRFGEKQVRLSFLEAAYKDPPVDEKLSARDYDATPTLYYIFWLFFKIPAVGLTVWMVYKLIGSM